MGWFGVWPVYLRPEIRPRAITEHRDFGAAPASDPRGFGAKNMLRLLQPRSVGSVQASKVIDTHHGLTRLMRTPL